MRGVLKKMFLQISKNSLGDIHGGVNKMTSQHFTMPLWALPQTFPRKFQKS